MTQLSGQILIELAPLAALLVVGAIIYATLQFNNRMIKAHLASCDYVLFEAEPVNMACIEADLADCGWRLVERRGTRTNALVCRFEKSGAASRSLAEIFDFDRSMPRTSGRTVGTDSIIKIKGHGSRGDGAC